ncbi:hypothetical protein [Trichothermofontia sp.]
MAQIPEYAHDDRSYPVDDAPGNPFCTLPMFGPFLLGYPLVSGNEL